jgi:hypothetical protein
MHIVQRLEYISQQLLMAISGLSLVQEFIDGKWDDVDLEKLFAAMKDPRLGPAKALKRLEKARAVLNGTALPPIGKRHQLDYEAPVEEVSEL